MKRLHDCILFQSRMTRLGFIFNFTQMMDNEKYILEFIKRKKGNDYDGW